MSASNYKALAARGFSLVELMISIVIVGVALMVTGQHVAVSVREHRLAEHKTVAFQKALGIMAEIQASISQGAITEATDLDDLDDGGEFNPVLTTAVDESGPVAPDHVMSGNERTPSGNWRWGRVISVESVQGSESMRYVRISMLRRDDAGKPLTVASAGGLLNLASTAAPTVKVYDVYVLAIGAAPSMWMPLPGLRSLMKTASSEISARNSNLTMRLRWITKFGYGRNTLYAPYINEQTAADQDAPWAYWYPGKLAAGAPVSNLFASGLFSGQVRTEVGLLHGYDAENNPYPHAVADRFNHCMRLPEARALFEKRVAAGLEKREEPPLQLLLEDMHADPDRFRNAIVVNLHGEALPFPPLRNFADAAKAPERLDPGIRVVTHPTKIRPRRGSEDLELRVYAYKTEPAKGPAVLPEPITVQIMGVDLTARINDSSKPTLVIQGVEGGVDPTTGNASDTHEYKYVDDNDGEDGSSDPYQMRYKAGFVGGPEPYTWIRLHNTPLVAPVVGSQGLPVPARLYGMEYIPSPLSGLETSSSKPKNTARWRIRIPKEVLPNQDTKVTVKTRIGTDLTTGRTWPTPREPENLSTTYAWWAASPEAVPLTERYQFQGDPRHNPYADLAVGGSSFPNGYNWFFDDLQDGDTDARPDWPCLDGARLRKGFGAGMVADVPRMMQVWRDALQTSGAVFSNPGRLGGYLLLGGEIALPPTAGSLAPASVSLNGEFYWNSSPILVNDITADSAGPGSDPRLGMTTIHCRTSLFWAREWLGELRPDSAYADWVASGNLPCGSAKRPYYRQLRRHATPVGLPAGTTFRFPSGSGLGDLGAATLAQMGNASARLGFVAESGVANVELTQQGQEIVAAVGLVFPTTSPVRWGSRWTAPLSAPLPHVASFGDYPNHFGQVREVLATGVGANLPVVNGAPVVRLAHPTLGNRVALFVPVTDAPRSPADHDLLAKKLLVFGLRSFHVAGEPGLGNTHEQVPQLEITSPAPAKKLVRPSRIDLRWRTPFLRMDGQSYTANYPDGYQGRELALRYVVLYAREGEPFKYAANGKLATLGTPPTDDSIFLDDVTQGDESYLLFTPEAEFGTGNYLIRVECYHRDRKLHYIHHEVNVKIRR